MSVSTTLRDLHELLAALGARLPQAGRAGETAIARDADALRAKALERIAEIEDGRAPR